jgi:predicted GIY-YIG superfamily endonuclease
MTCAACGEKRRGVWQYIPARLVQHTQHGLRRYGKPTTIRTLVYECACTKREHNHDHQ